MPIDRIERLWQELGAEIGASYLWINPRAMSGPTSSQFGALAIVSELDACATRLACNSPMLNAPSNAASSGVPPSVNPPDLQTITANILDFPAVVHGETPATGAEGVLAVEQDALPATEESLSSMAPQDPGISWDRVSSLRCIV